MASTSGHIKIDRRILQWEWYKDLNTFKLFTHLLIKANYKECNWKGLVVKRGQIVTGRYELSNETGLSQQEIRTSIKKLLSTNEIETVSTNRNTIITICKYDTYQTQKEISNQQSTSKSTSKSTNKSTNKKTIENISESIHYEDNKEYTNQQNNQQNVNQLTTTKEVKEVKEDNILVVLLGEQEKFKIQTKAEEEMIVPEMNNIWKKHNPSYPASIEEDYHALLQIAYQIATSKGWKKSDVIEFKKFNTLIIWENTVKFIVMNGSKFIKSMTLDGLAIKKNWQKVVNEFRLYAETLENQKNDAKSIEISTKSTQVIPTSHIPKFEGQELANLMNKFKRKPNV